MFRSGQTLIVTLLLATLLAACSSDNGNLFDLLDPELEYELPGDIPSASQSDIDRYSWKTFLALSAPEVGARVSLTGDNSTQYSAWSSPYDLIRCNLDDTDCVCPDGDCGNSGTRYYPQECQQVEHHTRYRVLDNADKADDSFLEAETGGLSNQPVLTSQGGFVRYEILINPAFYRHAVDMRYYDWNHLYTMDEDVINLCGDGSYTGGDPADPRSGTYEVKLAWMEQGLPESKYHREDILVYTPSYRSSTGTASCELKSMALVGVHIAHKTQKQPGWTWSTFEHADNAPDCGGLPPAGSQGSGPTVNPDCPAADTLARQYHFTSPECADGSCAECNVAPQTNDPLSVCVTDPTQNQAGWCLDQPPATVAGKSQLCRQVPIEANYPTAYQWNNTFAGLLGDASVWSSYQLVSTQWFAFDSPPVGCANTAPLFEDSNTSRAAQRPQVAVSSPEGQTRPFLGNSSMESYERSNCNACHAKATIKQQSGTTRYMDFVYWIAVESCATWCELNSVQPCSCYDSINQ